MAVVLCIDDDVTGLMLRKLLLETRGYIVLTASNGEDGIQIARKMKPDVLVLDFQMPHMDGGQVARIFREELPAVPIILLSGSGEVPLAVTSMVNEYFQKGSPDLLQALDRALTNLTNHQLGNAA